MEVRIAKNDEKYGIVDSFYSGDKVKVILDDGTEMMCRIAGKLMKKVWVKVGDIVLVKPWPVKGKGDIIHVYSPSEAQWLKKNGYIKNLPI
jgi:translation initiation factor 1A